MCAGVTADRGFTWSDEETSLLLQLWGDNDAQSELTGNKRNFIVYEKISETMNNMGFIRTASQCREKIKRMKREYTLTKQHNEKIIGPKKSMRFYDQFEKILLEKQSKNQRNTIFKHFPTNNDLELETVESDTSNKRNREKNDSHKIANSVPKTEPPAKRRCQETNEKDAKNPWTPDVVLVEEEETQRTVCENQCSTSNLVNDDLSQGKKRKMASRMSAFRYMMDSLTLKFMKYQVESDTRFLNKIEELENERNAMDERIQKMWLEFEERRLLDEKEHELKVMSAFQDVISQINHVGKKD